MTKADCTEFLCPHFKELIYGERCRTPKRHQYASCLQVGELPATCPWSIPQKLSPSAVFTPNTGVAGTSIVVTGYKWPIGETINIGNVTIGSSISTHALTVNSKGEITGTITCPSIAVGVKDVVINGTIAGVRTFTNAFTVAT